MTGHRVQLAAPEHLPGLPGIERAAARMFESYDSLGVDPDDTTSPGEFAEAQREGQLWVAITKDAAVVGFALAHRHGGHAHLEEVDVHPDHGRRGLGAKLVNAVCDWAGREGLGEVTLTTFREVPWNAPFYRRLGFEEIPEAELSAELREIVDEEAADGLDPGLRVVMRRRV